MEYKDKKKARIFFTGGTGLLSLNWALQVKKDFNIILGVHKRSVSLNNIEFKAIKSGTVKEFERIFDEILPDIVVNNAGITNVEECENNPIKAREVNSILAGDVSEVCFSKNIPFVHISTDHIFGGKVIMKDEKEKVFPLNSYASSKIEGEKRVLDANPNALIIRTNFYGWGPSYRKSFSDYILTNLRLNNKINLFKDVYFTPIIITKLVEAIHILLEKNFSGVFNIVGNERISKYEFGKRVAEKFRLKSSLIQPILFSSRKELVNRPLDLSLSNNKFKSETGNDLGNVDEHLSILKNLEKNGFSKIIGRL